MRHALSTVLLSVVLLAAVGWAETPLRVTTLVSELPGGVGGLTVDALGFIYVADFGEKVWKISPEGEVKLFADTLYGSSGNAVDAAGNLLQANFNGNSITKIARDGSTSIFAKGINGPVGLVVGADQTTFVCSCRDNVIHRVDPSGEISVFASGDLFNCPNGITQDDKGNLYVVNFSDGRMVQIDTEGQASLFATLPGGGNGHVTWVGPDLYATAFRGNSVYRVSIEGEVERVGGTGAMGQIDSAQGFTAQFSTPNGIAYDRRRDILYTNDFLNPWSERFTGRFVPHSSLRALALATLQEEFVSHFEAEGALAARRAVQDYLTRRPGSPYENIINAFAYFQMGSGGHDQAEVLFDLNTELFPGSFNAWDGLGELHKARGNLQLAIDYYRKSLELNPDNRNATAMLAEMEATE